MRILSLWFILLFSVCYAKAQHMVPTAASPSVKLLFEKIYLHTDRDVYAKGDTLWFKAYLVNAQDNKPVNSSGTLYVELIALDSAKILNREIIRMDKGLGNGDFTLADTLKAGSYRLRAYTNWMRNFGDNFVFEKEITILNTQAAPVTSDPKATVSTKNNINKTATATLSAATATQNTVRFYPEGGSLVNGISSIVGVKAEDANGKGIPLSGAVLSSSGDTVSRFRCDSSGMGLLAMLPIAGQSYHAVAGNHAFVFPFILSKGLALQVKQKDTLIHAIVNSSDTATTTCLLTLKHAGTTVLSQQLQLSSKQLALKIPTTGLPEGISAITIYDKEGKPECERLVYIHSKSGSSSSKISITTNKKSYHSKEQVTVNINAQPGSSLSMAVVDAGMVPVQQENIVSYLNLQSELRGTIENPGRYFDTTNVNRYKQIDQLLLTQGWRDFVWRRLADTAIRISYAAENGITVSGRIRDENLNRLLPGLNITLNVPEAKGDKLFSSRSNSLGRFRFGEAVFYGKQLVKLSAVNEKGQSKGAFWVDTLLPMPAPKHIIRNINTVKEDSLLSIAGKKRQEQYKIPNTKGVTQLKEVTIRERGKAQAFMIKGIPNINAFMTWGGPTFDQSFNITPKDYELKTLRWFALANFNGAQAKGNGIAMPHGPIILIVNGEIPPLGIPHNLYYSMPIEKFKSIHIQRVVDGHNDIKFLLFLSLKDNYLTDNPGALTTNIEGYYQARTFYEPSTTAKQSINDYRTTIYWEPDIKTAAAGKATVSFYNALPQTDVRIIVQGITDTGIPMAETSAYQVK